MFEICDKTRAIKEQSSEITQIQINFFVAMYDELS